MELLLIAVLLVIAAETTYLTYVSFRKDLRIQLSPVFVDTSVLIDGRIISIAESGFTTRPLYIPRSVVGELQFLADNADSEKRSRARHGLDVINQLQSISTVTVRIFADGVKAEEGVDNRLLKLAKKHSGAICTIDYNLNKVAVVEGIEVLNVNELAKSLRMAYLPGEKGLIELSQKGNDSHQAVGHLEDGTMVVVEHANKQIGSIVEVEFIRSLQTAAGKMMFAKLVQPQVTTQKKTTKQTKPVGTAPVKKLAAEKPRTKQPQSSRSQQQPQQQSTQVQPQRQQSSRNRRRSPEDSMIELANKQ